MYTINTERQFSKYKFCTRWVLRMKYTTGIVCMRTDTDDERLKFELIGCEMIAGGN